MINWIRSLNWKRIKDSLVNVVLALIVVVGLGGVAYGISEAHTNTVLTQQSITVSNRHHDQTSAQNSEIIALTKENHNLLAQHSSDIANESQLLTSIQAADAELAQFAAWLIEVDQAQCAALGIVCPAPPSLSDPAATP